MRILKTQQKKKIPIFLPKGLLNFAALVLQCQVYFYFVVAHQLHARFPKELLAAEAARAPAAGTLCWEQSNLGGVYPALPPCPEL